MFGIPVWVLTLAISVLQKLGAVDWAEALIAKGITRAVGHIAKLQTYSQYPTGKNGQ